MKDITLYDDAKICKTETTITFSVYTDKFLTYEPKGKMPNEMIRVQVENDKVIGENEIILDVKKENAIKLRDWLINKYPLGV